MSVLIVLPPTPLQKTDTDRALEVCKKRLGEYGEFSYCAPADSLQGFREQLSGHLIDPFDLNPAQTGHDIFVFVEGYSGDVSPPGPYGVPLADPARQRSYWFMLGARLKSAQPGTYDEREFPFVESHIFQRLSGRKHEFVSFPYGPLYSDVEVGPVNQFGFRVPPDYRKYANRSPDHKLVVVFGGSAAFSFYTLPDEMFATRTEVLTNEALKKLGSSKHVTVLNFGMHDNVVMQQMLTYMLFVHELKPDIVLSHDGHNDLYYGLQDDPVLLNEFDIIYQRYSEEWAKILHKSENVRTPELYSMSVDGHEMNMRQNVLRVYMKRKRQFEHMVRANGGDFVWGVQPVHASKAKLSEREWLRYRQAARNDTEKPALKKFLRSLYYLYDLMSVELEREPGIRLVDFHRIFKQFGENDELLWDHVHTSPAGDEVIARYYRDAILPLLEPGKGT